VLAPTPPPPPAARAPIRSCPRAHARPSLTLPSPLPLFSQTLLKDSADVKDFLENPTVDIGKKKDLLARVGREAGLNEATVNFLNLLVDNDRFVAATAIFEAFELQYCALTDTQVATVRSAVKLEQEQQFLIAKKLQELTGSKNIKLKPAVDPALIAGFVVEYGSSQVDLSVKGQLDRISSELVAAE
jgi:F-type H+-transporting ATPase subunit delta